MTEPFVLFVDQTGAIGGAELMLLSIARARAQSSHVLLFTDGPFRERLNEAGVPTTVMQPTAAVLGVRRESNWTAGLRAVPSVLKLVWKVARQARDADVIYANSQKAFVVAALASFTARKPLIWHLHAMLSAGEFSRPMIALAVRLANARASHVIAVSGAAAEAFRAAGGTAPVTVVYNGVDPAPFDAVDAAQAQERLRAELKTGKAPLVGVFSRFAEGKGLHTLVEALPSLPDVHAVFVGAPLFGEDAYAARLRRLVSDLGLGNRVHFLGFRDDVPELMKGVDIIASTSIEPESFSRAIIEGMLAGKPGIVTTSGGSVEIHDAGQTGLLVPPGDAAALATAIRRLVDEPDLAADLARGGRHKALTTFALGTFLQRIAGVIGDVHRRSRPG